ncbi:MAG: DUF4434 domain-containing protein [Armatimonadota bacterium]
MATPLSLLAALVSSGAVGLTVIPPGPVTDRIEVEIRLAVRNPRPEEATYGVRLYWDAPRHKNLIEARRVAVRANGIELVTVWAPTAERTGRRAIVAQVRTPEGTLTEQRWPITVVGAQTPSLPLLTGAWVDPGVLYEGFGYPRAREVTAADVRDAVDAMHRVGMDTVIVTYVEFHGPYYPSAIEELGEPLLDFDVVGTILGQADRNRMHVFLGLGRGDDTLLLWDGLDDAERIAKAVDLGKRVAGELWSKYGHHASFYGWYLTHEANDLARAAAYYDPLADFCHGLAPEKPVMIAPAGTPIITPEIIGRSHVDIFAYQDAVGAGYKDYQYTLDPEQRIAELHEVYGHYRDTHAGTRKHLWSDLEIWRANPETGYAPFHPAPIDEVRRQIAIEADYVEMITAYEFLSEMEAPQSTLRLGGDEAVRLYREYQAYYDDTIKEYTSESGRKGPWQRTP